MSNFTKNNTLMESLRKAFLMADKDGDGFWSWEETRQFFQSVNFNPSETSKEEFRQKIASAERGDLVNKIVFKDFEDFFSTMPADSSTGNNDDKSSRDFELFSQIDADGNKEVTAVEVTKWLTKNGVEPDFGIVTAIMKYFDVDGDGHITLEEVKSRTQERKLFGGMAFLPGEMKEVAPILGDIAAKAVGTSVKRRISDVQKFLGEIVEKDTRSKEDIEDSRWAGFVNFRRRVQEDKPDGNGRVNTVMLGTDEIIDILPGVRQFQSIFNFDDLVIRPKFTEIKGVKWIPNKETGKGTFKFPSDFDEYIETDIGTSANLNYYGATLTNTRPDSTVTLDMRHVIQDFTYSDNYLEKYVLNPNGNKGAGMERHKFSHLDVPLDSDSGLFVIGKFMDEDETILHVTGFRIPAKHCMLLPGGIPHSNDYLKGTWRTMLSDSAPIDYVHLQKDVASLRGVKKDQNFHFKFHE